MAVGSFQTDYSLRMAPGYPGLFVQIIKSTAYSNLSVEGNEAAAIPLGRIVTALSSADGEVIIRLPSDNGAGAIAGRIIGTVGGSVTYPTEAGEVPSGGVAEILESGTGWVEVEGAVTAGSTPFVRFAASGELTSLGVATTVGDATTAQIPNAFFESDSTSVAGVKVAKLALNLPAGG